MRSILQVTALLLFPTEICGAGNGQTPQSDDLSQILSQLGVNGSVAPTVINQNVNVVDVKVAIVNVLPSNRHCASHNVCSRFPGTQCWHTYCVTSGSSCTVDGDCPYTGTYCIYGKCTRLHQNCYRDYDCPFYPLTTCDRGRCVKAHQQGGQTYQCRNSNDCRRYPAALCISNQCLRVDQISCLVDQDCPVGTVCSGDRCMKKYFSESNQCSNNFDCSWFPGAVCVNNRCLKPTGLSCQSNQDCAQGTICVNNGCYETPPPANQRCTSNSDCSQYPGTLCVNHKCVNPETIRCQQKWNCPPLTTCVNYRCVWENASNHQCSSDLDCAQYPGTYCIGLTCKKPDDISCQSDSDCPSGTQCMNNKCASPGQTCSADNQCPFYPHYACIRSTCVKVHQNCTVDEDCPNRPYTACIQSLCEKVRDPCTQDNDCRFYPSVLCFNGFCAKPGGSCTRDRDCPNFPATRCVQSKCVRVGDSCTRDENCPSFPYQECTNSRCQKASSCSSDGDCPLYPPYECIKSLCIKRRNCTTSTECPFFPDNQCLGSQCVYSSGQCKQDSDCQSNRVCVNSNCIRMDLPCSNDESCPYYPSTRCVKNVCIKADQISTTTAAAGPSQNPSNINNGTNLMKEEVRWKLVDTHNSYRSSVAFGQWPNGPNGVMLPKAANMRKLEYNRNMEDASTIRASWCNLTLDKLFIYENLYISYNEPDPLLIAQTAVRSWFQQVISSPINPKLIYSSSMQNGLFGGLGFMKAAWADSFKVGCGIVRCPGSDMKTYVLCQYTPQPFLNEKMYEPGEPCQRCKSSFLCLTTEGLCLTM